MTRAALSTVVMMVVLTLTVWADVKGRIHIKSAEFVVADAVAYKTDDGVEVALLAKAFDRKAAAKDSKIDSMDVMRNGGPSVTLRIGKDGSFNCVDWMSQGGGSLCNGDLTKALKLSANTAERVAGTFKFDANGDSADLTFDLKVESKVVRTGTPLPANGGEPGKAALAHFAAIEKGNFAALKATAPPDVRKEMEAAEKSGEAKEMFQMMREMSPKRVRILGGLLDGDEATLDFEGTMDGKPAKGTVDLVKIGGVWYVRGTSS
jgi:hypothetical protein